MDRQSEAAALLIDALWAAGVREMVVSPGSRSTPLVFAAARRLRLHLVIDERTAGFFALGRARVAERPVAALCTSGSAPAHWYPALLEAEASYTPLIFVSADRPVELVGCHANQAMDQHALFGAHVRGAVDVDGAALRTDTAAAWRRRLAQTLALAEAPLPGPVHINWRAHKPLEPQGHSAHMLSAAARWPRRVAASGCDARAVAALVDVMRRHRRGMLVCGPSLGAPPARATLMSLAEAAGWPVWAEATSGLRFGVAGRRVADGAEHWWRLPSLPAELRPDAVVQIGAPPTSTAYSAHIEAGRVPLRLVVARHGWPDPSGAADVLGGDSEALLAGAAAALATDPPLADEAWLGAVAQANLAAWAAVEAALAAAPASEAAVARVVADSVAPGARLVAGNSLCVRNLDAFARGARSEIAVLHQRGLSGIDGQVAAAAGAAADGGEVTLLVGDVGLAHDVGSLAHMRDKPGLRVVVVDNGGGRIFEQLPAWGLAGREPALAELYLTPPGLELEALARGFGVAYAAVDDAPALAAALRLAAPRLIHVRLGPHTTAEVDAAVLARLQAHFAR